VSEAQRRMVKFSYEVVNQATGELIATGETVHVICDRLGRPKSLPEKYRKYFALDAALSPLAP
jgi:acyl-CoA thioesterase FadM